MCVEARSPGNHTVGDQLAHHEAQINKGSEYTTEGDRTDFRGIGRGNSGIGSENETSKEFPCKQNLQRSGEELDEDASCSEDNTTSKSLFLCQKEIFA